MTGHGERPSRARVAGPASALALLIPLLGAAPAVAETTPCDSVADFPCTTQIEDHALTRAPTLFKLQARVAQAGSVIGEAKFPDLSVKLRSGNEVLCTENFKNVQIRASMMNLEIGREIDCELDDVLASNADLNVQLCYGQDGKSCLPQFPLASVANVVRATWAWTSERAHRADRAAQAHYAHRFIADRDFGEREVVGTGYFDLETPDGAAAAPLYDAAGFAPYENSGFLLWTPVRNRDALTVAITGKDHANDRARALEELVFGSRLTRTLGVVTVAPRTAAGVTVTDRGVHVTGVSGLTGALTVHGPVTIDGLLGVASDLSIGTTLRVDQGLTVMASGLASRGASRIDGLLAVTGTTRVAGALAVTGDVTFSGGLEVQGTGPSAMVKGGLTVSGASTAAGLHVLGSATLSESLSAPSLVLTGAASTASLKVGAALTVSGDVHFKGPVTFLAGTARPGNPPNLAYVQFSGETRSLAYGGAVALVGGALVGGEVVVSGTVRGARFQLAGAPPAPCDATTVGLVYFDMATSLLRMCANGNWRTLGGGGVGALCGNGFLQAAEGCDDGNLTSGDGCSATCALEGGFMCIGSPTVCTALCGDGLVRGKETCDDGNQAAQDGCTAICTVAGGWTCSGTPSLCRPLCGDGLMLPGETCDDGNSAAGDGCSATCEVEPGFSCDKKQPSQCMAVPLVLAGYGGVAGPDLRSQGLSLCAGAGPADKDVTSTEWLALCDGKSMGDIVFACSIGDDATAEVISLAFPLAGKVLTDATCDDWFGAALWPLAGDRVLSVDATANPGCGDYSSDFELQVHFGVAWTCQGSNITPGLLGQSGGRLWAYVRMP